MLPVIAIPLIIIGLGSLFFAGHKIYKEKKSYDASKGDETLMAMEEYRRQARFIHTMGAIIFVVVFVTVLSMGAGLAAALIAASICGGLCSTRAKSIRSNYAVGFKDIVRAELSKVFDNLKYEPNGSLDWVSVKKLDFFPSGAYMGGNDLIDATYKGLHFTQCDLSVRERRGGIYRFQGRAMRFDFAAPFRGRVQVVTKNFDGVKARSSRKWQVVETELAEFAKCFTVYALDPVDAMAALTPQMIEGIFYLKKALDVPTAIYFIDNYMYVFKDLSRETFDISEKKTLLEERALLKRDIALITGFLEVMYFRPQKSGAPVATSTATNPAERATVAAAVAETAGLTIEDKSKRVVRKAVQPGMNFGCLLILALFILVAAEISGIIPAGPAILCFFGVFLWKVVMIIVFSISQRK